MEAADRQRAKAHLATQQARWLSCCSAQLCTALHPVNPVFSSLEAPPSREGLGFCEVEKQMAAVKAKVEPGPSRNSCTTMHLKFQRPWSPWSYLVLSINLSLAPPTRHTRTAVLMHAGNELAVSCCQLLSVGLTVGCPYWWDFLCLGASILSASPSRADFHFWSRGADFRRGSRGPLLLSQLSKKQTVKYLVTLGGS